MVLDLRGFSPAPVIPWLWGFSLKTNMKKQNSTCKYCSETKPRDQFRLDSKGHLKERICLQCRWLERFDRQTGGARIYRLEKKDYCEKCLVKYHKCQLDVDHIDNNHENNDPSNLQTLCANCHRLKTFLALALDKT